MFEAKFFRDYKHSYMILPCGSEQPERNYTCRLLTSNKLEEILGCSLRHVNGASYYYYDISSRTTLENLYRGRQLSFGQVKELFEQLYGICGRLGDYFMDEKKLVLLPAYIFYDLSGKKYIGFYYPDYEEDKPYEALMDYLLEHMDSQDERLANAVYQIYEQTEESAFSVSDALRILGEQEECRIEEEAEKEEAAFAPNTDLTSATTFPAEADFLLNEENMRGDEKREAPAPRKKYGFSGFLIGLSVLGIAGIACVYGFYELSEEEMLTLLGCGALMGVCLLAGFAGLVKGCGKKEKKKGEIESFFKEEEYLPVSESASLEGVLFRETERVPLRGQKECGDTVFFDNTQTAEYKLYALDRRNKRHIELIKFPYTIGKMAGCVDCVLADDSVSRIHARFEREKDVIRLIDMNSTNGTYKNGLRLQPQEMVEIEPGDEIRFGNLNYCYR